MAGHRPGYRLVGKHLGEPAGEGHDVIGTGGADRVAAFANHLNEELDLAGRLVHQLEKAEEPEIVRRGGDLGVEVEKVAEVRRVELRPGEAEGLDGGFLRRVGKLGEVIAGDDAEVAAAPAAQRPVKVTFVAAALRGNVERPRR